MLSRAYDASPWVVLAGITLWLILKVTGVINTPLIIEYAPIFGAVYLAGAMVNKLNTVITEVKNVDGRLHHVELDVGIVKERIGFLQTNLKGVKETLKQS